jgi:hypothetical protein
MIVDDCFYHGDVLAPHPSDAKGSGPKPAWITLPAATIGCESHCRCRTARAFASLIHTPTDPSPRGPYFRMIVRAQIEPTR